jgi:hypothetical protein
LLVADTISWSVSLGRGTPLSLLKIKWLSAMVDPDLRVGPEPAGALGLWVQGRTVSELLARVSVSNGSSFGPGQFYRSAWQRPYPIKNRRFFMRTITLRPQILVREFSVWYVKYAAQRGASFGSLRFSISSNQSKQ